MNSFSDESDSTSTLSLLAPITIGTAPSCHVRGWAKKAGKFCQATLQWVNSNVGASQPSTRYPLSGKIYCETENPCERSQLCGRAQGMNSDRVRKNCFKVGHTFTFKTVRDMAKSEESVAKELQLMHTEVHSINVPEGYQRQGNQRPTPNTGSSRPQACKNCGWGPTLESSAQRRILHVTTARK